MTPAPLEPVVRSLMYRNNQLHAAWHALARRFGGEVGRAIVATMQQAEDRADKFDRTVRTGGENDILHLNRSPKGEGESNGNH